MLREIERSLAEPEDYGIFILDVERDGWRAAGTVAFAVESKHSRIAHLGGLAVHPDERGRGVADTATTLLCRYLLFELGYHRLQLEIYGFNERAMRQVERCGFVREGVRRKAYRRHGGWVDGVLYGLVHEDLEEQG